MISGPAFDAIVAAAAVVAGSIASIAGFGIGSLLTPLVALRYGIKAAVSVVAVSHAIATAIRLWQIRADVDRGVLVGFGLMNAAGALVGALVHTRVTSPILTYVLAGLLIFAGALGASGRAEKLRFGRTAAWIAGAVSGAFGGLVGNQGGIRSAAMLGLGVKKEAFVATATAIAFFVDAVRLPVYVATGWRQILEAWPVVIAAIAGVVVGTVAGVGVLRRIPERIFRRVVAAILLLIGIALLASGPIRGR
ncbi:MAG: TSUP family transporter [Acidobacteriota bacterium]